MRLKALSARRLVRHHAHGNRIQSCLQQRPNLDCNELLDLGGEQSRSVTEYQVGFGRPRAPTVWREAIAEMQGVSVEHVQVVRAPRKPLLVLIGFRRAGPTSSCRCPAWRTFALPESLGLELRYYRLLRENSFRIEVDRDRASRDSKTKRFW